MQDMQPLHYAFVALLGCVLAIVAGMLSASVGTSVASSSGPFEACVKTDGLSDEDVDQLATAAGMAAAYGAPTRFCPQRTAEQQAADRMGGAALAVSASAVGVELPPGHPLLAD